MNPEPIALEKTITRQQLQDLLDQHDQGKLTHHAFPVVDFEQRNALVVGKRLRCELYAYS